MREQVKYPLLQLVYFIGDKKRIKKYENDKTRSGYFPLSAFIFLPAGWKTDYSVDVISSWSRKGQDTYRGVGYAVFHLNWYGKHLAAMKEPVLTDTSGLKVYRFIWLRTFHPPIVVRLENNNGKITLYWKETDGRGGYNSGKLIINRKRRVSKKVWQRIEQKIKEVDFWHLPSVRDDDEMGLDGAQWILEGAAPGRYHVVDRWSGGEIQDIGLELLKLTRLKIKKKDIY